MQRLVAHNRKLNMSLCVIDGKQCQCSPSEGFPCEAAEALRKDAERYRWLANRTGLDLRSEPRPNKWKRMDGTTFSATHYLAEGGMQHAPADSLDATIDAAMFARRLGGA